MSYWKTVRIPVSNVRGGHRSIVESDHTEVKGFEKSAPELPAHGRIIAMCRSYFHDKSNEFVRLVAAKVRRKQSGRGIGLAVNTTKRLPSDQFAFMLERGF